MENLSLKCAISYSHEDTNMCKLFKKHLNVLSKTYPLKVWCDMEILGGQDLDEEIKKNFKDSDIIFLLVSNNFVASYYCFEKEMKFALQRHKKNNCVVIPIIISKVANIDDLPFGKLNRAPKDGKPINTFASYDKGFSEADIVIGNAIKNFPKYSINGFSDKKNLQLENHTPKAKESTSKPKLKKNTSRKPKSITYRIVKDGKPTDVKMTQALLNAMPNYYMKTSEFSKTLSGILNNAVNNYEAICKERPIKQNAASNIRRLKYFREFLFSISEAISDNFIGKINTRIHFRRLNKNNKVYEGLVVAGGTIDGFSDTTTAKQLSKMPSQTGMIFLSGNLSLPLIRSLNKSYHQEGINDKYWIEHLTCTFKEENNEQTPLLSMGISLNEHTLKRHKTTLLLMAYLRLDLIIETAIRDYISRCKSFDPNYELSNFITARF